MNEVIYLDEQGNACSENDEIYAIIDDITAQLMKMSKEQRIAWFRKTQHPHPINFDTEIDGTVYSVSAHFNDAAKESLLEKAERIILKKM